MVKYVLKDFKSILNKYRFIDSWFWCRYSINPYNGCEFACTYCDSRSHKYHLQPEFDHLIYVKTNIGDMLDNRLKRARTLLPDVVSIGGTCDAYQPAENKYRNTRAILGVLLKHHYPVILSTKSTSILGDLDLLSQIAEDSWCTVGVTITTLDGGMAKFLEPKAPNPDERLAIVHEIKKRCPRIQVGVNFIPIVPFLCDNDENLEQVVRATKYAGADFILFGGGMTMRDNQALWFMKRLQEEFPHLVPKYEELYKFEYKPDRDYNGQYEPKKSYLKVVHKKLFALCEKYDIGFRIKRYIPEDYRKYNYIIAQNLLDTSYVAQMLGKSWWNTFWAAQNINNLKEDIREIVKRGKLTKIRNVNEEVKKSILKLLK